MRNKILTLISGAVFALAALYAMTTSVYADDLDFVSFRLDRMKASETDVRQLIVIEPSTLTAARLETTLRIQFASQFGVDSTPSNITTTTTGIPSEFLGNSLTPMPGMTGTASSVSSNQVDFTISNLTDGTYYAFYITAGIDNPSQKATFAHIVSTRDGGGEIDTKIAYVDIVADDQIVVSASVPAKATDGELAITSSPTSGSTLDEGDEVTFTITYRSDIGSSEEFEIVASWEKARIGGSASNLLDAFEYVVNSATTTDDGTEPVIDTVNRTITWTIDSLAPSANSHTVQFKLKVIDDLGTSSSMDVDVNVDGSLFGTALPQDSVSFTIQKQIGPTNTPTATPKTTATPTPTGAPGVTPVPDFGPLEFISVDMRSIRNTSADIEVVANQPVQVEIMYGTSPSNLNQLVSSLSYSRRTIINLSNLKQNTRYYFRVVITSRGGESLSSDIFTFKTTALDSIAVVTSSKVFWKQIQLAEVDQGTLDIAQLYIPRQYPFTLQFELENAQYLEEASVKIVHSNVLGISSDEPEPSQVETKLVETSPGIYTGELLTPSGLGQYQLELYIQDTQGGFYTEVLPYLAYVSRPTFVRNTVDNEPIEHALVKAYRYNEDKQLYTLIGDGISIANRTDEFGYLDMALPAGKYRLDVSALGFHAQTVDFELEPGSHTYPRVDLEPNNSLWEAFQYFLNSATDFGTYVTGGFEVVSLSQRARLVLNALAGILVLGLLAIFLAVRMHIPLMSLPLYVLDAWIFKLEKLIGRHKQYTVVRVVEDVGHHRYVSGVKLEIKDKHDKTVLKRHSNIVGEVKIKDSVLESAEGPLTLNLSKRHYHDEKVKIRTSLKQKGIKTVAMHSSRELDEMAAFMHWLFESSVLVASDVIVIGTLLMTSILLQYTGFSTAWPLIITSIIALLMWVLLIQQMWILHQEEHT